MNAAATAGRFSVSFEALERVSDYASTGARQYVPLVFTHREKVTGHDRLLAAFYALALAEVAGTPPTHAKIVHGRGGTATRVAIVSPAGTTEIGAKARRLVDELAAQVGGPSPPPLTLNDRGQAPQHKESGQTRRPMVDRQRLAQLPEPETHVPHS